MRNMPATTMPAGRIPPFLLVVDEPGLVLIAPFPNRRRLRPAEAAAVRAVSEHVRDIPPNRAPTWIDAQTGAMTPAAIGEDQLRRRLIDCASFDVRVAQT